MSYHFSCLALSSEKPVPITSSLTLQEGKRLLQQLTPGSQEHLQLQIILLKTAGIFEITVSGISYKINTFSDKSRLLGGAGEGELIKMGNKVQIPGLDGDATLLKVGSHSLKFSHIVALAGGLSVISGETISFPGGDHQAKTARFQYVFNIFKQIEPKELEIFFFLIIHNPLNAMEPCCSFREYSHLIAFQNAKASYSNRYIYHSDLFAKNAEDVYQIGHTLALQLAKEASKTKSQEKLKEAYAIDAFACHFLTNLFKSGHIRNQYPDLETILVKELKFTESMGKKIAKALSSVQHEEDRKEGLQVQDQEGKTWRTREGLFTNGESRENQKRMIEVMQQSIDEIYTAYSHLNGESVSPIAHLTPYPTSSNPAPIYEIKENALILYNGLIAHHVQKGIFALRDIVLYGLKYLPQTYMHMLLFPEQESSPWIPKMFFLQFERISGSVWQAIGSKEYTNNLQLHDKTHEMGAIFKQIYDHTSLILSDLKNNNSKFLEIPSMQQLNKSIGKIRNILNGYQHFPAMWSDHLDVHTKQFFKVLYTIPSICMEINEDGKGIFLTEYIEKCIEDSLNKSDFEIKIRATLWFRQILELQAQIFALYLSLKALHNQDDVIGSEVESFIGNLKKQVEINKALLDEKLIVSSSSYIHLQLKKLLLSQQNDSCLNKKTSGEIV
ncbi:hypothetical protein [Rhabdochlamydiaceae symbiont of Dictyostelium giganteum]|uniref:hypothetical protein n=1 Tax=Rhabdochlamydiaceae symbiont of Dictyostelium giganteum TaxID=3342349 RepID=UPI00385074A9